MAINYSTPKIQASGYGTQYANNKNTYYSQPAGPVNPSKQVLGASTSNYNIPGSASNYSQGLSQGISNIQSAQGAGDSQIESDYNQAMSMLSGAESGLRGQADIAGQTIDQQAGAAKTEIGNTQSTAEQGVSSTLQTAEKQGTSAMQQARDLFRQTQQSNNAQLSALGISSSSVSEALAERLGVETARRIAGVTGSLQEARVNATQELGRVKTYYQSKIEDIAKQTEIQKAQIQQSLIQGLNQINAAKGEAASAKSQARASLLSQVQSQIYSLTQQQQQFQQSLDQWAAQKQAALTPIAQDPNYLAKLVSTANTFNQQFTPQGFQFVPEVSMNAQGTMTGKISTQSTKQPKEDPLAALYKQAGVTQ